MSKTYELVTINNSGNLKVNKEAIAYLKSIKQEVVILTFLSSTESKDKMAETKINLISNILNKNISDENINGALLHTSELTKESTDALVLIINIKASNKHLFSLFFLCSSLLIFLINRDITDSEILNYKSLPKLPSTLESSQTFNREVIFTECSPKSIFYINNCQVNSQNFPRDYLDSMLRKKTEAEYNLIKECFIKYFPDRDCIFDSIVGADDLLKSKLLREMNPKTIRGKLFNGESLAFFIEEYCDKLYNNGNPNFDDLWIDLVKNDLSNFKNDSIELYNHLLEKLNKNMDEEDLLKEIYKAKIKSINKFNEIFKLNIDTFNNSDYKIWYIKAKNEIEEQFIEIENNKLLENSKNNQKYNTELLKKEYAKINEKVENNYYTKNNIEEYLKDYEKFINNYKAKSKGKEKLKMLIEFLNENKIKYYTKLIENLNNENNSKINDYNDKIKDIKNKKEEMFENYKKLNDETEQNGKKVEDLNSEIEKKKREIKSLNDEINRVEGEINKARESVGYNEANYGGKKSNGFNIQGFQDDGEKLDNTYTDKSKRINY